MPLHKKSGALGNWPENTDQFFLSHHFSLEILVFYKYPILIVKLNNLEQYHTEENILTRKTRASPGVLIKKLF